MREFQFRLLKFACVGVINSVIYGISTALYVSQLGIDGKIASILGYCTALPFAFFAHRAYTFESTGEVRIEVRRFVITQVTSLLVAVFAMAAAIDYFGLHYAVGIVGAVVLVPLVNFFALDLWVFRHRTRSSAPEPGRSDSNL